MLRLLALQDETTFRQIARHPERVRLPQKGKSMVPLSVLDPTQGVILDSAPARLTSDIASRFGFSYRVLQLPQVWVECFILCDSDIHASYSAQSQARSSTDL